MIMRGTFVYSTERASGSPSASDTPAVSIAPYYQVVNGGFTFGDRLYSGDTIVNNVMIENIKFSTLQAAISPTAQLGGNTGSCPGETLPSGLTPETVGTGSLSSIVIRKNWFYNDYRSINAFGSNHDLVIQNNLVIAFPSTTVLNQGTNNRVIGGHP